MGFFDIFSKKTTITPLPVEQETQPVYQTFGTPMITIPSGDLTNVYVRSFSTAEPYVRFGESNLYPQIVNQLVNQSSLQSSIIKYKANSVIGGGIELNSPDKSAAAKVKEYAFLYKNKFPKLMAELTEDFITHNRVHVLIKQGPMGQICYKRISPEKIRLNEDRTRLTYSYDWSRYIGQQCYPEYYEGCTEDSIFSCYGSSAGCDVYPLPTFHGALNWLSINSEIPSLQRDNITNSIFPSYIIKAGGKAKSQSEIDDLSRSIKQLTQSGKRGKAILFTNQNLESLPTVDALPTNDLPKLFTELMKDMTEQICIANMINPIIMGVRVAGSLGNTNEIQDSEKIFEKNVVMPLRKEMEYIGNELLSIGDINSTLIIKNYQIEEDGDIVEVVKPNQ